MTKLIQEIYYTIHRNMTFPEAIVLMLLAVAVWFGCGHGGQCSRGLPEALSTHRMGKLSPFLSDILPVTFSVCFILYITLLRRAPDCDEEVRLAVSLYPNGSEWAGNLLNLALFVPLGWTCQRWKPGVKCLAFGTVLSILIEVIQYSIGLGWMDVNDVLFNALGTAVGMTLARTQRRSSTKHE